MKILEKHRTFKEIAEIKDFTVAFKCYQKLFVFEFLIWKNFFTGQFPLDVFTLL